MSKSARGVLGTPRLRWPFYNKKATGCATEAPAATSDAEPEPEPDPIWRRDVEAGNSSEPSRHSNESYPAQSDSGPETADLDLRPSVPTPEERIGGILEEYGERMFEPISTVNGRTLRADCLEEPETVSRTVSVGEHDEIEIEETASREATTWIGAVETLLERYETYRDKWLKMSRGDVRHGDYESFEVPLEMSYSPEYQSKQYARLKALKRQLAGGTYPDTDVPCEGEYVSPVVLLLGLTTSSLLEESFRPVVDHDRAIREAWSGSSSSVKRTLRYLLEDKMGLAPSEYAWWWQSEPHPGGGAASGYSHSHPVVIFDSDALADDAPDPVDPETYRPVVAKHVSECEGATWDGHRLERAVTVSRADDVHDIVAYVSDYLAVSPDEDLLSRSDEYIMWAAAQFASSTQKYSRSKWATAAAKADACQQQYMDGEAHQSDEHGERVVRASAGATHTFECAECGSPHGIDQSMDSLARHRLDETASTASTSPTAIADGGEAADSATAQTDEEPSEATPQTLEERWPSARAAGRVSSPVREAGEPGERTTEGFIREPTWRPESIVRRWSGEETEIGEPSGVEYAEVLHEGAESILATTPFDHLPSPEALAGPEPWRESSLIDESDVRLGLVPPPELVARELVERTCTGRRVTPKEWRSDWYEARFGSSTSSPESAGDGEPQLASGISRSTVERVRELVRTEGVTSVPSILGRLSISPEHAEAVGELVGEIVE